MGIEKRVNSKGELSYRVSIRKRAVDISRTFMHLEDAELFEKYRTRLIDNMANFDIPINERVRLCDIVDLKIRDLTDKRAISELELSLKRIEQNMKEHTFLCELSFEDWSVCFKKICSLKVPKKSKSKTLVFLSPDSLRRIFATLSSAFSYAKTKGIKCENYPLKVMQEIINPLLNKAACAN